jgi:glutaredoxin
MTQYVVYGADNCAACKQAVQLLHSKKLSVSYKNIAYPATMQELSNQLPGVRSIPQIFKNDIHLGGLTDLQEDLQNDSTSST